MDDSIEESDAVWREYIHVGAADSLQQGDLIKFSPNSMPSYYGIVVTADCDLDKRKHSRLVTLVPLLSVDDIVCSCLAFDAIENHAEAIQQFCRRSLNIEDPPSSASFMGKLKSLLRGGLVENETVQIAVKALAHEELKFSVSDLKLVLEASGVSWVKALDRFRKQIESRGDLLRLTNPPLTNDKVSIAWLRSIWQERISSIAIRTSEQEGRDGIRVAQLNSPFRYRLTQMLSQVFSDIGLPDIPDESINCDFKRIGA
jgi:hypothetical protein